MRLFGLVLWLVWFVAVVGSSLFFTGRALKRRDALLSGAEGEEQHNVRGVLPRIVLWGFLYPGIVFLVVFLVLGGLRSGDSADVTTGVLLTLVLVLVAVPVLRATDIRVRVFSDHLIDLA